MVDQRWPGGARIAVCLNVMYEQWALGSHPGLGPMGNPLPTGVTDYQALSWSAYGARTGIWALLELLARYGSPASVYVSGLLAETAPDSVAAVVEAGHELCGHAWSQDLMLPGLGASEQAEDVARTTAALTGVAGVAPSGWMSPRCTPSDLTAQLLAGAGYAWTGDVFDADLPYELKTPNGPIVALPFGLDINDLPMMVRYGDPGREISARFHHLLEGLTREDQLAYIDVTVHAHVAARPVGRIALVEVLEEALGAKCWIATRGALAAAYLGRGSA